MTESETIPSTTPSSHATQAEQRILAIIHPNLEWGRATLRGITTYAYKHTRWHLSIDAHAGYPIPLFGRSTPIDGVICGGSDAEMRRQLYRQNVKTVVISSVHAPGTRVVRVAVNDAKLAEIAIQHLKGAGFRHFAFAGGPPLGTRRDYREEAFIACLKAQEIEAYSFRPPPAPETPTTRRRRGAAICRAMARWLKTLPKPAGIFAWNAGIAREIAEACALAGLQVPADIGILSGDDDRLLLAVGRPTISAISYPAERIGYEAARMLDALLTGRAKPGEVLLIDPSGAIVERDSTRTIWGEVHQAVQYIREHTNGPLTVDQLAAALRISRRTIERKFHEFLGRSPFEEITRVRLERAQMMLLETELPLALIAERAGFSSSHHLITALRRETGLTPSAYRKRFRVP